MDLIEIVDNSISACDNVSNTLGEVLLYETLSMGLMSLDMVNFKAMDFIESCVTTFPALVRNHILFLTCTSLLSRHFPLL